MIPSLTFPSLAVKICGLSTPETMAAALDAGADMVGLVFHPKSPRFVSLETASALAAQVRGRARVGRARVVALVVDLPDERLREIIAAVQPDVVQCHGREDAARLAEICALAKAPVMKAVGVAGVEDLPAVSAAAGAADLVLLDAKPPKDAAYPGGHGRPFNWRTLAGLDPAMPFMLSGGLHPANVAAAIREMRGMGLRLLGVDVSSGVESAPGLKDVTKIRDFIAAARAAAKEPN